MSGVVIYFIHYVHDLKPPLHYVFITSRSTDFLTLLNLRKGAASTSLSTFNCAMSVLNSLLVSALDSLSVSALDSSPASVLNLLLVSEFNSLLLSVLN